MLFLDQYFDTVSQPASQSPLGRLANWRHNVGLSSQFQTKQKACLIQHFVKQALLHSPTTRDTDSLAPSLWALGIRSRFGHSCFRIVQPSSTTSITLSPS